MGERSFRDCPGLLIEESQDSDAATSKLEATLWCGLGRENCAKSEQMRKSTVVAHDDCWCKLRVATDGILMPTCMMRVQRGLNNNKYTPGMASRNDLKSNKEKWYSA